MKTKIFVLLICFISTNVAVGQNNCGEGGAATWDCSCEFNRATNNMLNDHYDDVRACGSYMYDPAFLIDMFDAYQRDPFGTYGALNEHVGALECIHEAQSDMWREIDYFGDVYRACLCRYGCC